jgi:RimJ/RimL family protein N-acetyltransferase
MMAIPTIRTERLVLRPMAEADFPAYRAMMASPRSRWMGGPVAARVAWGMFCHDIACWTLYGHGGLMIEVAATGECVGQVGINGGPMFPETELGWLVYSRSTVS